jgi:methyltransferase family protein
MQLHPAHQEDASAMKNQDKEFAGYAVYSPLTLSVYDALVLGVSNPLLWKCPTPKILDVYNQNVSANHLDVGVGTGWYLDHCRFPDPAPRLALMDANGNSLDKAAGRVARYGPETYLTDVLQPIPGRIEPFDSIALTYLLHCLPGTMEQKCVVLDHLRPLLRDGGVMFGATILGADVSCGGLARKVMAYYNARHIFSNTKDSLAGLEHQLHTRFDDVQLRVIGCVALFRVKVPGPSR